MLMIEVIKCMSVLGEDVTGINTLVINDVCIMVPADSSIHLL